MSQKFFKRLSFCNKNYSVLFSFVALLFWNFMNLRYVVFTSHRVKVGEKKPIKKLFHFLLEEKFGCIFVALWFVCANVFMTKYCVSHLSSNFCSWWSTHDQRFSIGFRSGHLAGQGSIVIFSAEKYSLMEILNTVLHGARYNYDAYTFNNFMHASIIEIK